MRNLNILEISRSPLILEFTREIFEEFYHIQFSVPKRQVIDDQMVSTVAPDLFKKSMVDNLVGRTEPIAGRTIYYVEGKPLFVDGVIKIQGLLNDLAISRIECQGPNTPLIIVRQGIKQFTRITLSQAEIRDILEEFTDKARIPLVDGVVHVAVDNLEVQGVYSDLIKSNFTIMRA